MKKLFSLLLLLFIATPVQASTVTAGHSWSNGETVTATKLNNFVNNASVTNIVNADISASANIADSKLDQITTSGKVSVSAITGTLDIGNGGTGVTTLTDGGLLLGSGTGGITAMSVLADGALVIGDGTTDPTTITAFTSSTGTLKHEQGGIEADISAIAKGGLVTGTGAGTMAIKTAGTDNHYLYYDSGSASGLNSGAISQDYTLSSSTSPSALTETGDMTIQADRRYLLTWSVTLSGNDSVTIKFNNTATGTNYSYFWEERKFTDASTSTGNSGGSAYIATHGLVAGVSRYSHGWAIINTNDPTGVVDASVSGQVIYLEDGTDHAQSTFGGVWQGGASTDVELSTTGGSATLTGEVRLYELADS